MIFVNILYFLVDSSEWKNLIFVFNFQYFCFMNQNQIRFARTLTATWKVLRDPVLTAIYLKKWKRRKDITQTIYGFVFNEMYRAA